MTGWPYPSYADRRWLGGERSADKALAAVVRAVRGLAADADVPVDASAGALLAALSFLADLGERVDWAMLSLVGEARTEAAVTWAAIGEALGVTKQAAQQRFAPYVREALAQATERSREGDANEN